MFVCIALVLNWSFSSADSPLWDDLNILPYILGVAFSNNVHQPSTMGYLGGLFIQWSFIGFLVSLPISMIVSRRAPRTSIGEKREE
jgi:hypothetical protein